MTRPPEGAEIELDLRGAVDAKPSAGAFDMGSNAIRYAIGGRDAGGRPVVMEAGRYPIRLGQEVFTRGELSGKSIERAVGAASSFRRRLDELGIRRYRAVATSAVRESRNGAAVVEALRDEAGIELEVIDGSEEARLVFTSVATKVPLDSPCLVADLGGGSLEISLVSASGIEASISFRVGSVRLLEQLGPAAEDNDTVRRRLDQVIEIPTAPGKPPPDRLVITGGNADALADVADPPNAPDGISELTPADLARAEDDLRKLSVAERITRYALRPDRADVIVIAAVIFRYVAERAGVERLIAPRVGVQHGLIAELVTGA